MVSKKYIKQAFKHEGIQLAKGSIQAIEYELKLQTSRMAKRCKKGNDADDWTKHTKLILASPTNSDNLNECDPFTYFGTLTYLFGCFFKSFFKRFNFLLCLILS